MLQRKITIIFLLILSIFYGVPIHAQFYNGSQQDFGKNRVQHREFIWTSYKFTRFDVYFYAGGMQTAIYASNITDELIEETENYFDYILEGKIQLIIYNKLGDLKQSNIGFTSAEEYNVGGVTRIVGSKVFIYYDGDHNHLEQQIKAAIAEVLISQMMYGGSWKDRIKNSTLLTLPEWYIEGLISLYSTGWNEDVENKVKDGILSGRFEKFNRLSGRDAKYAGHSIWNFIVERYGESLIPSIIYMTKVSRNIESGMLFVLGSSLKNLTHDWLDYYKDLFYGQENLDTARHSVPILKRSKSSRVYSQLKVSPDGKYVAFATNQIGRYKVWVYDFEKKKAKPIMRFGYKIDRMTDYSYPLLAWSPTSDLLSIITEKKDRLLLTYYFTKDKKKSSRPLHNFHKILDFSYSDDGKKFVMSAINNGQSDIYVYHLSKNTHEQITADIYDDFQPRFINNSTDIVFSSNRTSDTLYFSNMSEEVHFPITLGKNRDIYLYNYSKKSKILKRITKTPKLDESQPIRYEDNHISYLVDESGIRNRYLVEFDSVISHIDTIAHYRFVASSTQITNYKRSIMEHDADLQSQKRAEIIYINGKHLLYVDSLSLEEAKARGAELENNGISTPTKSNYIPVDLDIEESDDIKQERKRNRLKQKQIEDHFKDENEEGKIDIDHYVFEVEKEEAESNTEQESDPQPETRDKDSSSTDDDIEAWGTPINRDSILASQVQPKKDKLVRVITQLSKPTRQWNYNTAFSTDYFISQLDNRYLNSTYQKFTGGGAVYTNPGLNLFFKIGVSDLLDDFRIAGGARLSSNFNNNEYFLSFENLKRRFDKQVVLHRQSFLTFKTDGTGVKIHTHDVRYTTVYPINEVISLKGSAILRNDRNVILSTDRITVQEPNTYDTWGGLKAEFIFDNTISRGLNLYNGTRYKVFFEWYKQVDKAETDLYVIGLDFRHYQKIHRDLIWANRFAISSSFGDNKLVYYLGGVDGWLKPQFDKDIVISQDENYAYQTLATNMRGFWQNVRNGNSFAVINSELRFPVFKFFMNRPMKSDFLRNFQILAFGDIGTAWTGKTPYSSDNSFNTDFIENGPITVRLIHQREPVVAGYGIGLRTRLWGYFIRIDYAKGIQDGISQKGLFYWSLSLDF